MGRQPRRNHSPAFKVKAAVSAIKREKTLIELTPAFNRVPPTGPVGMFVQDGFWR